MLNVLTPSHTNHLINQYIHQDKNVTTTTTTTTTNDDNTIDLNKKLETRRLNLIKNKINEVIPRLEEKCMLLQLLVIY